MGLVPIMIGTATGSDVMKRMAAPMFGGLLSSFTMESLIYPVIFLVAKQFEVRRGRAEGPRQEPVVQPVAGPGEQRRPVRRLARLRAWLRGKKRKE